MRRARLRLRRLLLTATGMVAFGLASMTTLQPLMAAAAAQKVVVNGAGEPGIDAELVSWQNALFGSSAPVVFNYASPGTQEGRRLLLTGQKSFAVSSVPFTDAELAGRAAGSAPFVSAPFSVQSLSAFFSIRADQYLNNSFVPPGCNLDPLAESCDVVRSPFTGVLKVPPATLLSQMTSLAPPRFDDPLWQAQLQAPDLQLALAHVSAFYINFDEGSSSNKFMIDYVKALAPKAWSDLIVATPDRAPSDERISGKGVFRVGYSAALGMLTVFSRPDAPTTEGWGANAVALSTQSVNKFIDDHPSDRFVYETAQIANKHGDYLAPTQAAVQAALDAGGETPNYAATNDVPGAYPLVQVNRLYAPSTGLSMDQTNAVAALIRYVATDGQQDVVDNGGVALTAAMKSEAIQAADRLVTSNCTGADQLVTSGGPGPNEPATPGVAAIGTMKHCALRPPPETTTTTEAETTTIEPEATTATTEATTTEATTTEATTTTTTEPDTTTTTTPTAAAAPATARPRKQSPTATRAATVSQSVLAVAEPPVDAPVDTTPETTTPDSTVAEVPSTAVAETTAPPLTAPPPTVAATYSTTLPLTPPDDGRGGFKKLGTFILGAGGFLLGRGLYLRRLAGR